MLKKKLKLSLVTFLTLSVLFSFSFNFISATESEPVTTSAETSDTVANSEGSETSTDENQNNENSSQPNIEEVSGDLYLFDNNIEMNKYVDGSVFLFGKKVKVTGQVNGNLFVFADSVEFDNCYVRSSIFVCANDIVYNGYSNDLYATAQKLNMTFDSYVIRDAKISASEVTIKSAIGRDLDLSAKNVDFGSKALKSDETNTDENSENSEDSETVDDVPIIYGNLRYSAKESLDLKDGIVEGEVTYKKATSVSGAKVSDVIFYLLKAVVTAIVVFLLLNKFASNFVNELSNKSWKNVLLALGVGLVSMIAVAIVSSILVLTKVGAILGIVLISILVLLALISTSIVDIYVTKLICNSAKLDKKLYEYLILVGVALLIAAIKYIPYAGSILSLLIIAVGIGLLIYTFYKMYKNK